MPINKKSGRQTFRRRFVSGSLFVSPCPPECYLQISGFTKAEEGLPTSDFRTSNFRLPTSDLRTSDFWPFRLKAEWLDLRTSHFPLPTSAFRLLISHFPLPLSHFLLLTSDFRFPTSDFQLPTSDFQLPSSNFRLLTWLSVLLGSIAARSTTRVLMLKVKAQWKGWLYRSRHKKEQPNLLLKKQLTDRANPATDEVRLENRNHGLAWSQSGNNKTVQTLAVNLILACLTGALRAKRGERGILREARNECESLRS